MPTNPLTPNPPNPDPLAPTPTKPPTKEVTQEVYDTGVQSNPRSAHSHQHGTEDIPGHPGRVAPPPQPGRLVMTFSSHDPKAPLKLPLSLTWNHPATKEPQIDTSNPLAVTATWPAEVTALTVKDSDGSHSAVVVFDRNGSNAIRDAKGMSVGIRIE